MKKLASLLLSGALALGLLAGCGGTPGTADTPAANTCLLYTSDAADDMQCVDLGGRRIIKKIFFFQAEDGIRD